MRVCIGVHGKSCEEETLGELPFCADCNREYLVACKQALAAAKKRHQSHAGEQCE